MATLTDRFSQLDCREILQLLNDLGGFASSLESLAETDLATAGACTRRLVALADNRDDVDPDIIQAKGLRLITAFVEFEAKLVRISDDLKAATDRIEFLLDKPPASRPEDRLRRCAQRCLAAMYSTATAT